MPMDEWSVWLSSQDTNKLKQLRVSAINAGFSILYPFMTIFSSFRQNLQNKVIPSHQPFHNVMLQWNTSAWCSVSHVTKECLISLPCAFPIIKSVLEHFDQVLYIKFPYNFSLFRSYETGGALWIWTFTLSN